MSVSTVVDAESEPASSPTSTVSMIQPDVTTSLETQEEPTGTETEMESG